MSTKRTPPAKVSKPQRGTKRNLADRIKVPLKYQDRIVEIDRIGRADDFSTSSLRPICIYLHVGWVYVDSIYSQTTSHMITVYVRDAKDELAAIQREMAHVKRCYCYECTDDSGAYMDGHHERRVAMALRKQIAIVNKIPLDGSKANEARLDAILREAAG